MRYAMTLLCGAVLALGIVGSATAQEAGTCTDPIEVPPGESHPVLQLDTRGRANLENGNACVGDAATGPDIVLGFGGSAASGTVTWTSDFRAIVYYRQGECDFSICSAASTDGILNFYADWNWNNDHAEWATPYIVVDGLDGEAGQITLTFDYSDAVPTSPQSWGKVKSIYR